MQDIAQFEADLWEAADNLRANSKLTSSDYFMPVLGVIFLRHAAKQIQEDQAAGRMPNHARGAAYPAVVAADFERAELSVPPKRLILCDLEIYHEASKSEIQRRIGAEIPSWRVRRALREMRAEGVVLARGERKARRYLLNKTRANTGAMVNKTGQ